jgi:hypothetical protein
MCVIVLRESNSRAGSGMMMPIGSSRVLGVEDTGRQETEAMLEDQEPV